MGSGDLVGEARSKSSCCAAFVGLIKFLRSAKVRAVVLRFIATSPCSGPSHLRAPLIGRTGARTGMCCPITRRPEGTGSCWRIMTHDGAKIVGCREKRSGCRIRPVQRYSRPGADAAWLAGGAQDLLPPMLVAPMPQPRRLNPGALPLSPGYPPGRMPSCPPVRETRCPKRCPHDRLPRRPPPLPLGVAGTDSHGLMDPSNTRLSRHG